MKRVILYLTGILLTSLIFSCDDYLEAPTKSSMDESVIFSTPDLAKSAIDGIKISFGETNSYRGRFLPWYGMNTDVEWYNSSETPGANSELVTYSTTPSNSNMNTDNNTWAKMYEGIERANMCIKGLRTYGNPQPGTELGYLLGEALTLRAVYYADLLKAWGDVVKRFEPITTETLYLPKTSRDTIYKQLIADLGEAANLVPWPNETEATTSVERINKAFVKGFRARLCLAAGGYSQYPDGIRRSDDPELSVANMYAIAKQECVDVINSGTCRLESSFETIFRKNCQDIIAAGGESLWEIPFSDGRGRVLFTFAVKHNGADKYTAQARGGQAGPVPNMFYDYDVKDTRRDVTVVAYDWAKPPTNSDVPKQQLLSLNKWSFGKYRYEWMTRRVTSTNDDGVNKLYMRYAEVILMAAEIMNELEGSTAAAPYLKMIRQRAFKTADWSTKVDAYVGALTTKEAMFNAIVEEHKLEFCGEMERKQALIRWNLLKTKLDEAKEKMYDLRSRQGEYADVPETLYYNYADDGEALVIYGLNRGETADKSGEYGYSKKFVAPDQLVDNKIETIYVRNPDEWQFWPIWQYFLDNSNGQLTNDYGY